ncbi:MauE/DoxX family redox-associated membrane protein [Achromobacter seleniivolatilans]|uniref:Methylamine utilization protein MauE n=1 Tax=Achromobacter seleniivolatilans TaxID=3047478 RepID=A0ABY9LX90_9BURK|nr:MauE/DoxX family redox-associated membrane protein [Achromobacter sp. R39]WMD18317.1 MauE/DoxX family redox-associated membrane protein [Achromobacter sp. R39]
MIDPIFQYASAFLLALVTGSAAASKAGQRDILEGVIANYRVLPSILVRPTAYVLPIVECAICLALLFPMSRHVAAAAALVLIGIFTIAIGVNLIRGRTWVDCGCFSSTLRQPISWGVVARNAFFMIAATLPLVSSNERAVALGDIAAAAVIAMALFVLSLAFSLIAPGRPDRDRKKSHAFETVLRAR